MLWGHHRACLYRDGGRFFLPLRGRCDSVGLHCCGYYHCGVGGRVRLRRSKGRRSSPGRVRLGWSSSCRRRDQSGELCRGSLAVRSVGGCKIIIVRVVVLRGLSNACTLCYADCTGIGGVASPPSGWQLSLSLTLTRNHEQGDHPPPVLTCLLSGHMRIDFCHRSMSTPQVSFSQRLRPPVRILPLSASRYLKYFAM